MFLSGQMFLYLPWVGLGILHSASPSSLGTNLTMAMSLELFPTNLEIAHSTSSCLLMSLTLSTTNLLMGSTVSLTAYCCGWWLCRSMVDMQGLLSQSQPSEDLRHQP